MKDVLVVDFSPTSPTFTAYFSHGLASNNIAVDILSPDDRPETVFLKHLKLNYIGSSSAKHSWTKLFRYVSSWLRLIRIAPNYRAVHIQWLPMLQRSKLDLWMLGLLLRVQKNVGYTVHNVFPHDTKSQKVKNRYRLLYEKLPHLIVHTPATSRILISDFGIPTERIKEVPHGPLFSELASFDSALNQKNSPLTLGMIGIIKPYKGYEDALNLIALAKSRGLQIELKISGAGPDSYIEILKQKILELDIADLVSMNIGYLTDQEVIDHHKQVHGILAPYKRIEQSGAAITAISLGKPVIGFAIGGLVDLIENKKNGYLVSAGDQNQLCNALLWLSEQDHKKVYDECTKSLEKISWKTVAETLKSTYGLG